MSITIREIVEAVSVRSRVPCEEMLGKSRKRNVVFARHLAAYLARVMTPHSTTVIGKAMGGRDHTTIVHAYHKMKKLAATDVTVKRDIEIVCKMAVPKSIVKRASNVLKNT